MEKNGEMEANKSSNRIPHWRLVIDQARITPDILNHKYDGSGTEEDPYVVTWIPNDPGNPMNFSELKKWSLTAVVAIATLAVAFVSSAYSGGVAEIIGEFGMSQEVAILGISLFVVGFALGPLIWAPMSELFGRQVLFFTTYGALTAFNAGACGSQNTATIILLRFFAGAFGSSPLTNAGGVIADIFTADERGVATAFFAAAPFLGPVLGPIVGGFVGETIGWRWIEGVMAIFTGVLWIIGTLTLPETYAPVLLRKRAAALAKETGKVFKTKAEIQQGKTPFSQVFKTSLSRPWKLLFVEPIVFLLSIYMAIIYGTLYMLFAAFPIVYQEGRGWSQGIGGLAFLGVGIGMVFAVVYSLWDNKRYIKAAKAAGGFAPPEARLPPCMLGGACIAIGLFWFAWTNSPSLPWEASVAAGIPFGFGMVLVFLSILNYLIDSYTIFAASVLAANAVIRSLFGAAFPLFTTQMYENLGIHWASTIPAFLALMCVPFPFLFYKYGPAIRARCKYAKQAADFMANLRGQAQGQAQPQAQAQQKPADDSSLDQTEKEEETANDFDDEYQRPEDEPRFEHIKTEAETAQSNEGLKRVRSYDSSPYDIDRVATRESFNGNRMNKTRSRTSSRAGSVRNGK